MKNTEPRKKHAKYFDNPSLTKQAPREETNINHIVAKFHRTGHLPVLDRGEPRYGVAPAIDYHQAMNLVSEANQQFESMPSKVRAAFDDNPMTFLSWMENSPPEEELEALGLLQPKPNTTPSLDHETALSALTEALTSMQNPSGSDSPDESPDETPKE